MAITCQGGVETDGFLIRVLSGKCRRGKCREYHDVNQERDAPGWQQVTKPDTLTPPGSQPGNPRDRFRTGRRGARRAAGWI